MPGRGNKIPHLHLLGPYGEKEISRGQARAAPGCRAKTTAPRQGRWKSRILQSFSFKTLAEERRRILAGGRHKALPAGIFRVIL
jgi:hypothetical protein